MKVFRETSYNLSRKLLILTGLWPFTGRALNLAVRVMWCCFIISFEVLQLVILKNHDITIIRLVYFVSFSSTLMILCTKYFMVIFLQGILKKSLENLARWHSSTDQGELRIFEKFGNNQKRTAIIFISFGVATLVTCQSALLSPKLLNIVAPLNNSRLIRFMLVTEFQEGDDYFVVVYVFFAITCVILVLILATSDCIMSIMLHYHSAVYETISYRTNAAINEWLNPKNIAFEKDHRLYQKICGVIDLYQDNQRDFECIMAVIAMPYFIIIMMITFSLCIYTFQDTLYVLFDILVERRKTNPTTTNIVPLRSLNLEIFEISRFQTRISRDLMIIMFVELLHTVEYWNMSLVSVSTGLIQIAYAYRENGICQTYIDNSVKVYHEICHTPWYALPLKVQKLLLLVLQRTSKGCVPVFGGLFVPSRKGFTWMLNTAFSYFTVIYSIRY